MEKFLENFVQREFGRSRKGKCCVTCGSDKIEDSDFRDRVSLQEFAISHMCQKCQDSVFGSPEDEESADSPCYDYWAEYNNRTDR